MRAMIAGAPEEARWLRGEPRRTLPGPLVERIVRAALPRCRVIDAQPLTDGLRNANFKIRLDSPLEFVVLRIYEDAASLCQKEIDLAVLCESLTHDELPDAAVEDLVELIGATAENRDPQFA
ncbi:MAG: hypothetical protein WB987_01855 [Candidatus Acidiferrales bacterium]